MIVVGTDVVESYFAAHAGHKGTKAARLQYDAWLDVVARTEWKHPEDVKASYPKVSILKASRVVFNIKGDDYRLIARVQYQAGVWRSGSLGRTRNTTRGDSVNGRNHDLDRQRRGTRAGSCAGRSSLDFG